MVDCRFFDSSVSVKLHLKDGRTDGQTRPSVLSFVSLSVMCQGQRQRQRHRPITLVERLKSHTATSEALVMSQAKVA